MATRQQLEQQLVAAHRSGNVQAAQQAAYAIRQYDQSALSAQVPSINAPPLIERVPKPTFGSWLENVGIGIGEGLGEQVQGIGELAQRGASALGAYAKDPLKASAAAFMGALSPAMRGFTQPAQVAKDVGAGVVETGKQMYQQATSGPVGLGTVIGQNIDIMPGPNLPGGKRRPTMAEIVVHHGTPHTFEPEEGAPLGRFRSSKIGTGEGAQAYGYGLYLAESPGVAKTYRTVGTDESYRRVTGGMNPMEEYAYDLASQGIAGEDLFSRMHQRYGSQLKSDKQFDDFDAAIKMAEKSRGNIYKVDLPDAKIEQMLDWDKPLSKQSKSVQDALKSAGLYSPEITGDELHQKLFMAQRKAIGSNMGASVYQKAVANQLNSLGIPGIKYLDAGSRAGEKGTRNFVVFPGEEQNLTILERDGVKAEVPKPAAPKPAASTPRVATWFSGGGTVESALPTHERVMAAEYNPQINAAANKALGTSFPTRDVNKIDPQELKAANPDLFHASPVCKNFSAAKTMRGATELDRESANSVANAIRVATPPVVTIENVPQYADTALFRHITDALDEKGYKWDVVIHDAADYGAPQSRKRMLLRAVREGELPPLPPKTGGKDWFGAVSDLLPDAPDSIIPPVERRRLDDMIAAGKLDPSKPIITMGGSGFKGTWSAANAGQVAPTLKAANEKPRVIMPDGTVKTVTGRMMARLMGLGDDVPVPDSPTLAKTVLGNGISGDVTRALIAPLLNRNP